ncbi:cadmium-translocating P-type ATPase [Jannaschia sp. S6380]|uniref:heavy metal translocating P-type ATPase n=1 Tax=Jannaschia sp. S6380 TaxID=2926408 RepID=UPI001FF1CC69|nr:heavy metal translocating P-type ATPase [Jannaschia sp. S6380]MCK0167718.1 cadmium-translocating P-type ATPase [Jannaschia sp. S6380]
MPHAASRAARDAAGEVLHLSLPGVHCAACIAGVEATLARVDGIRAARVNLGRRRVRIVAAPGRGAAPALAALAQAGFEAHEMDEAALDRDDDPAGRLLLARIAVAGFAMMNVMALSVATWSGATDATLALFHWISAAIALPAVAFAALPFFTSAWSALRAGRLNMDVPIALAIALACATSLAAAIRHDQTAWFDAALSLTFFLLAGRYLDHRARRAARSAAADLAALELPRATRLEGDIPRTVPVEAIAPGDRIALAAFARAPVDGTAEAAATLDRSALTGESAPVRIAAGDRVCAGEIVLDAPLVLRATARAEDSTLRRLAALVEVAETGRHRYSGLADRAARLYAPVVHVLAALAFLGWWAATGQVVLAIGVATAVLIITCPCALGLAVPAVTASMTGRLFRRGALVKSPTALERLAEIDCVLLDKTGTVTERAFALPATLPQDARHVAVSLARASQHPASRAIADALADTPSTPIDDLREVPGDGMHGVWRGLPVHLGGGADGVALRIGSDLHLLPLEERLRDGARDLVQKLMARGLEVRLVTGDHPAAAAEMAARLGLDRVHSAMRPEDKAAMVADLSAQGRRVLMVGDGVNDTAALAAAHAAIAPASALDAARVAADVVLLGSDLMRVDEVLTLGRRAARRILQNFALAAAYNLVAIPIALAGLATPFLAALAMSLSSISVVLNAVRS